jgi:hypothetical protein
MPPWQAGIEKLLSACRGTTRTWSRLRREKVVDAAAAAYGGRFSRRGESEKREVSWLGVRWCVRVGDGRSGDGKLRA